MSLRSAAPAALWAGNGRSHQVAAVVNRDQAADRAIGRLEDEPLARRADVDVPALDLEPALRRGRADTDVGVGGRAVLAVDTAEHQRVALRDESPVADGRRVGQAGGGGVGL